MLSIYLKKFTEKKLTELKVKEAKAADWIEKKQEFAALEEQLPDMLVLEQKNKIDKQGYRQAKVYILNI